MGLQNANKNMFHGLVIWLWINFRKVLEILLKEFVRTPLKCFVFYVGDVILFYLRLLFTIQDTKK